MIVWSIRDRTWEQLENGTSRGALLPSGGILSSPSPKHIFRWDSGNFGIYKVGEGEGEVKWVKCKCRTLNLLTPTVDLVEERKEEKTIDFDPESPSPALALPILPPCQSSFAPLRLMCPSVETVKERSEEEATPLTLQLATAQKVFFNIEDSFLPCPIMLLEETKEERAIDFYLIPPSPAFALPIHPPCQTSFSHFKLMCPYLQTLETKEEEEISSFHTSPATSMIASLNIEDSCLSCPIVFQHSFLPVSPPPTFASSPLPLVEVAQMTSSPSPLLFSPTTFSPMLASCPDSGLPKKGDTLLLLSKASNTWHKVTLTSHEKVC